MIFNIKDYVYLSKDGEDEYVNMLAKGSGGKITSTNDFVYGESWEPIVLRGILKHKIMKKCWNDGRDFYYIDTGYFGNECTSSNPHGWKYWHRIVKNDLQHNEIVKRPDDRWKKFNKKFSPWKTNGHKILIAAPDEKPCKFYNTMQDEWIKTTVETIKKYTDRPIVIRERSKKRIDRVKNSTLIEALNDDVFALVTFNSNSAVESVFHGIPVFTLAPSSAAAPVGCSDLSRIENPYYPDGDKLYAWACHLAYGQFHVDEMKTGKIWDILNDN